MSSNFIKTQGRGLVSDTLPGHMLLHQDLIIEGVEGGVYTRHGLERLCPSYSSMPNLRVAFLGPLGTFSHQITKERFPSDDIELVVCNTIQATVHSLRSKQVDAAVIPRENSIFGIVTETYGLLVQSFFGTEIFVQDQTTLHVQQCLLARKGTDLAQVQRILSHEQALGQSRTYLSTHYPKAELVKTRSTAVAAEAVAQGDGTILAVGCRVCADLYPQLEIVAEGIQDNNDNHTRFFVLGRPDGPSLPPSPAPPLVPHHELFRISLRGATITEVLLSLDGRVVQVDRYPDPHAKPFESNYLVEVVDNEELHKSQHTPLISAKIEIIGRWQN